MLKRRILEPIRLVLPDDEAIDLDASDYAAYLDGWCDWKHLKMRDGQQATVFTMRQLTHRQKVAREQYGNAYAQAVFTARCGLVDVSGLEVQHPDGTTTLVSQPTRKREGDLGELVDERWFEDARLSSNQVTALSLAAWAASEVSLPLLRVLGTLSGGSA